MRDFLRRRDWTLAQKPRRKSRSQWYLKFSGYLGAARANRCGKESYVSTHPRSAPTRRRFQSGDMSPHSKGKTGAVILAAGGSSRFGQPKQLILFRAKNLLCRVIDAAREGGCSPVVVVIGSDSERVTRDLEKTTAITIENKAWKRGIGSSVRVGVQGAIDHAPDVGAIVLLVCDQPQVNAGAIRNLIALRDQTNKSIVASSYAGTLGVPAL